MRKMKLKKCGAQISYSYYERTIAFWGAGVRLMTDEIKGEAIAGEHEKSQDSHFICRGNDMFPRRPYAGVDTARPEITNSQSKVFLPQAALI